MFSYQGLPPYRNMRFIAPSKINNVVGIIPHVEYIVSRELC